MESLESENEEVTLPPIRQDLQLLQAPNDANGAKQWMLYDPIAHAYHTLNEKAFCLLQHWKEGPAEPVVLAAQSASPHEYDANDIAQLVKFFHQHHLADQPADGATQTLIDEHAKSKSVSGRKLLHSYVFFRIPLIKPQKLLDRLAPFSDLFFMRRFWLGIGILAFVSLGLIIRQWDQFISTFFGFLSPEGFVGYALAIILTKIAHEFGHAFAAHRYGCRVTSLGVGIMLMFPILYADTTDAWRLTSRRKRLVIGAAGMGAELIIAVFATLIWNILPEGSLRAVIFFLATTSWVMTIFVNLNPLMRFDGYYLLADLLNIQNLQPRSNALTRWWLRETLFNAGVQKPENFPPRLEKGLIFYGLCVWVYRFFLFLGIAFILHGFIVKAFALALSIIEIGWFIVRPVVNEVKVWPSLFMRGAGKRKLISVLAAFSAGMIVLIPWQGVISVPAIMEPSNDATLYARLPGRIAMIHVDHGQNVREGDPLISLTSSSLQTELKLTEATIALLRAQLSREASDLETRAGRAVLQQRLRGEMDKHEGLLTLQDDLIVRAPITGTIHGLSEDLHAGRWINSRQTLMHIRGDKPAIVTAYVSEDNLARIHEGAHAQFFGDDPWVAKQPLQLTKIAPAGSRVLTKPILASTQGSGVAVRENDRGELVPVRGIFQVQLMSDHITDRDLRGTIRLQADRKSIASQIWRRVVAIINRESAAS